ncbi:hypothetical protein [Rhodopirellula halodulae]|uniref:hypothetical protein n=1 Tax=Rhodopirellula halodulae TaxID=2894198 RepID=UPI001E2F7861|nr:hypothetical protein [Rhodopirellula sp. JC737]MCC9656582.1 hypothetical protein [Rhodopirellula sp. JC737]
MSIAAKRTLHETSHRWSLAFRFFSTAFSSVFSKSADDQSRVAEPRSQANPYAVAPTADANPHEPTHPPHVLLEPNSPDELVFDGVITEADVRRLIPERRLWFLLAGLMWGIIIPAFTGVSLLMLFGLPGRPNATPEYFGAGLMLCVVIAFAVATQAISPKRRTKRVLKERPDLLGRAAGKFTRGGLLFWDGKNLHRFNHHYCWQAKRIATGVRVPLHEGVYTQLYLANHLFHAFDLETWNLLRGEWHQRCLVTEDEASQIADNVVALGTPPKDATRFSGTVNVPYPVDHGGIRRSLGWLGFLLVFFSVIACVSFQSDSMIWAGLAAIAALYYLHSFAKTWKWLSIPSHPWTWQQQGWIGAEEVAWATQGNAILMSRKECVRASVHAINELPVLCWELESGRVLYFPKDNFEDDSQWQRVIPPETIESPPSSTP